MQETWVQLLGWEDPLKKEMETHSSILAWKIPWTEEPGGLQSMGSQRVRQDGTINTHDKSPWITWSQDPYTNKLLRTPKGFTYNYIINWKYKKLIYIFIYFKNNSNKPLI